MPTDVARQPTSELEARALVAAIRELLNNYDLEQRRALVQTRNNFWLLIALTIIFSLAVVALALVLAGPTNPAISAGLALYLVAACAGLLGRLQAETDRDGSRQDYNLTLPRVVGTPFLSGLAGVFAVLVFTNAEALSPPVFGEQRPATPATPTASQPQATMTPTETQHAMVVLPLPTVNHDTGCAPGETPSFVTFTWLVAQLADWMGDPRTCEYPDPNGTGDMRQDTTTGLAFWRSWNNSLIFTNGYDHWGLGSVGFVHWLGPSIDPPQGAERATANPCFSAHTCQPVRAYVPWPGAGANPYSFAGAEPVYQTRAGAKALSEIKRELLAAGYDVPADTAAALLTYDAFLHAPRAQATITPAATPVPLAEAAARNPKPLMLIFDVNQNPQYLVLAALFGLTPNLLIGRMQDMAKKLQGNLDSIKAAPTAQQ